MQAKAELVRKSVGASILISLGCYSLLKMGSPIGPVLFTLGLLGVCYMGQNLFTGKCGFIIQDKNRCSMRQGLQIVLGIDKSSGNLLFFDRNQYSWQPYMEGIMTQMLGF